MPRGRGHVRRGGFSSDRCRPLMVDEGYDVVGHDPPAL